MTFFFLDFTRDYLCILICGGLCMDWFLLYPGFIYRARFINKFQHYAVQ